ncbi:Uncharacterized OB-fold protein, contains Zn-ribbon domain [Micromonospora viridifaciens]|uniref:Uncharacterized OB-fold protein, contains Zn-ribbon domain n=1 Tax=Micromonospora viridifaciens TaxID=1881 RepID=A0A1C4YWL0_MICVI|nr:hypothetical protein [Micromonospora viridifaciens]SCF24731.1 Uncharacterized OB-fold protein, contains Zn-ribbon domain [Micromonospora viridifaciens]
MPLRAPLLDAEIALPPWRIGAGPRQRTAADPDEDAVTLAWMAGRTLLDRHTDRNISALLFASTSAPLTDGANAATLVSALRLDPRAVLTQEFSGGASAGGAALAAGAALACARPGAVLVLLADSRASAAGDPLGSGAAAVLLDATGDLALQVTPLGPAPSPAVAYASSAGVVTANPSFTRWATPASARIPGLGDLGAAGAWIPLMTGGGQTDENGLTVESDQSWRLTVTGPDHALGALRRDVPAGRGAPPRLSGPPPTFQPYYSAPQHWRDGDAELALVGMRCVECDVPEFPAAPSCPVHGPAAALAPARLALSGTVFARTRDHVFPVGGPLTMAVVELADGARFYGQVVPGRDVAIGDPVRLVLRRMPTAAGAAPRYFYKITPMDGTDADQ